MYNPQDKDPNSGGGAKAQPGDYSFRVESMIQTTFNSGNEGLTGELAVRAFPGSDRTIRVFVNFVFTKRALWKLEEFMNAIGMDFNNPPQNSMAYVGKTGRATFIKGDKGYLEVGEYLAAKANNAPSSQRRTQAQPSQAVDFDNVPF